MAAFNSTAVRSEAEEETDVKEDRDAEATARKWRRSSPK
jgi:hypothetical protein